MLNSFRPEEAPAVRDEKSRKLALRRAGELGNFLDKLTSHCKARGTDQERSEERTREAGPRALQNHGVPCFVLDDTFRDFFGFRA